MGHKPPLTHQCTPYSFFVTLFVNHFRVYNVQIKSTTFYQTYISKLKIYFEIALSLKTVLKTFHRARVVLCLKPLDQWRRPGESTTTGVTDRLESFVIFQFRKKSKASGEKHFPFCEKTKENGRQCFKPARTTYDKSHEVQSLCIKTA